MAKFSELPPMAQVGAIAALVVFGSVGYYFYALRPVATANDADRITLQHKKAEVAQLAPYEYKVKELNEQIAQLNEQLERQKRIVPDEKDVPNFIEIMQTQAKQSGVRIRKYIPKATTPHDYYTEVPFDTEIDGPYYKVMDFFRKISQSERIITISGLHVLAVGKGGGNYEYVPGTSVSATCEAKTFYSSMPAAPTPAPAPAPAPAKKK